MGFCDFQDLLLEKNVTSSCNGIDTGGRHTPRSINPHTKKSVRELLTNGIINSGCMFLDTKKVNIFSDCS